MPPSTGAVRLKAYVQSGAPYGGNPDADDPFIEDCYQEAVDLVSAFCGASELAVPLAIRNRAHLEVGAELYNRRGTKNGISQFANPDGSGMRIGRDPLASVRPLLRPYLLSGGFA